MGLELHITRAEFWGDNAEALIPLDEWLTYVQSDPELRLAPEHGPYLAVWLGPSAYEIAWLAWNEGNIHTKWPDTALYRKMLAIATALDAWVQDDDGTIYRSPSGWGFDPPSLPGTPDNFATGRPSPAVKAPWWRRLFHRQP